jgi:NAD/NADP transhydrogenase beta subunit
MARVKWSERPRTHRGAIIGAFAGMAVAAVVVFEYAFYGSTLDRYLIMMTGLLVGGVVGALLARSSASR